MKYTVHIRKEETGEVREHRDDLDWHESSLFWWSEGNMGCDCNRERCFDIVGGEWSNDWEPACSVGKYTVVKIVLDDGTVLDDLADLNRLPRWQ
jgi:hypothetical protein